MPPRRYSSHAPCSPSSLSLYTLITLHACLNYFNPNTERGTRMSQANPIIRGTHLTRCILLGFWMAGRLCWPWPMVLFPIAHWFYPFQWTCHLDCTFYCTTLIYERIIHVHGIWYSSKSPWPIVLFFQLQHRFYPSKRTRHHDYMFYCTLVWFLKKLLMCMEYIIV